MEMRSFVCEQQNNTTWKCSLFNSNKSGRNVLKIVYKQENDHFKTPILSPSHIEFYVDLCTLESLGKFFIKSECGLAQKAYGSLFILKKYGNDNLIK